MSDITDDKSLYENYIKPLRTEYLVNDNTRSSELNLTDYELFIDLFQDIFEFGTNGSELCIYKIKKDEFNITRDRWTLHEFNYFIKKIFYTKFISHYPHDKKQCKVLDMLYNRFGTIADVGDDYEYTWSNAFKNNMITIIQGRNKFKKFLDYKKTKKISYIQFNTGDLIDCIIIKYTTGEIKTIGESKGGPNIQKFIPSEDEYITKISHCPTNNISHDKLLGHEIVVETNLKKYRYHGKLKNMKVYSLYNDYTIKSECVITDLQFEKGKLIKVITE